MLFDPFNWDSDPSSIQIPKSHSRLEHRELHFSGFFPLQLLSMIGEIRFISAEQIWAQVKEFIESQRTFMSLLESVQ